MRPRSTGLPVAADTACDPQAAFLPYVSEVELERLNLVRTSDKVLWKKLVDVGARLDGADEITLDGAGRITTWTGGVATAIDASPDQGGHLRCEPRDCAGATSAGRREARGGSNQVA